MLHGDLDVQLAATTPASSLPACRHSPCHDDNGLTI